MKWFLIVFTFFSLATPAVSFDPAEKLQDTVLETRAKALFTELRCLVCQNQSIAESNATLARDLRLLVRERLVLGDSDSQIVAYLVARYGEYILLRPRFGLHTYALWGFTPFVMILGIVILIRRSRRKDKKQPDIDPSETLMTKAEQKILNSLQEDTGAKK